MITEPIRVTLMVTRILEQLGVAYLLGGSLASAVHGIMRATLDADLVADIRPRHVHSLVDALSGQFYIEEQSIRYALRHRGHFNLIHLETMFKVDIFIPAGRPFDAQQFKRRIRMPVDPDGSATVDIATAEDTLLAKLDWYNQGGGVANRQWLDAVGIIRVQGEALEWEYLHRWAAELGLAELLSRAVTAAGGTRG